MKKAASKTQIDRLGDRLRRGALVEADIRMLDEYRRSFGEAYENVVRTIRERLQLDPTGRPAKSTGSIIDKLKRESIRLSQVQGIAGCRIVCNGRARTGPRRRFGVSSLPWSIGGRPPRDPQSWLSCGYVIESIGGQLIEIQIRSRLQHLWAELSEKFSDIADPAIKYGGGSENIRELLTGASAIVDMYEQAEKISASSAEEPSGAPSVTATQETLTNMREDLAHILTDLTATLERGKPGE